jgi:hypothetical protein
MICYIKRRCPIFGDVCRLSERLHPLGREGEDGEVERGTVAYIQCALSAPPLRSELSCPMRAAPALSDLSDCSAGSQLGASQARLR